ncbi:MAG: aminotransferase class V-fold PLP-dependent enzyme [Nitrospirota bacterium]
MEDTVRETYRREFPVTGKLIYLDHAGIAPVSTRVVQAMRNYLDEASTGGAFHYPAWIQRIAEIRGACARLVNAEPDEIAFVRNTSHGISLAAEGLAWNKGDTVLYFGKEFPSNIYPWQNLARKGVTAKPIPSAGGRVQIEDIERLMDGNTRLVAISSVQFSNGFRVDLKRLGALCRSRNILFCVDAIQSLGLLPMDVQECNIDFLSADAHKWLMGPEGIGIFYCRKELAGRLNPPLIGWKSVANELDFDHPRFQLKNDALRFEEGSQNLAGIFGLGAAIGMLKEIGIRNIEEQVLDLGDVIIQMAKERGFSVLTPEERTERGGNITIAGPFDPGAVRDRLRERGIMVNARGGGIRISPHFYNTREEILGLFASIDVLTKKT